MIHRLSRFNPPRRWLFASLLGLASIGLNAGCAAAERNSAEPPPILTAILLGIVQGLTEFLPVSSSGHLLLTEWLLKVNPNTFGLRFDAAIHLGTLLAVMVFYWRDLLELAIAFLGSLLRGRRFSEPPVRLAWGIFLATIPAGVAGVLFQTQIETVVRSPYIVAGALAGFGLLLWLADRVGSAKRELRDVSILIAVLIGCAQAIALVPGVSRSGITITAGLFLGLRRDVATRFAFLLSAPITAGAGAKQLYDLLRGRGEEAGAASADLTLVLIGIATAFLVGFVAIWFLVNWVASRRLDAFVYYRLILAAVVVLLALLGVAHP